MDGLDFFFFLCRLSLFCLWFIVGHGTLGTPLGACNRKTMVISTQGSCQLHHRRQTLPWRSKWRKWLDDRYHSRSCAYPESNQGKLVPYSMALLLTLLESSPWWTCLKQKGELCKHSIYNTSRGMGSRTWWWAMQRAWWPYSPSNRSSPNGLWVLLLASLRSM